MDLPCTLHINSNNDMEQRSHVKIAKKECHDDTNLFRILLFKCRKSII